MWHWHKIKATCSNSCLLNKSFFFSVCSFNTRGKASCCLMWRLSKFCLIPEMKKSVHKQKVWWGPLNTNICLSFPSALAMKWRNIMKGYLSNLIDRNARIKMHSQLHEEVGTVSSYEKWISYKYAVEEWGLITLLILVVLWRAGHEIQHRRLWCVIHSVGRTPCFSCSTKLLPRL